MTIFLLRHFGHTCIHSMLFILAGIVFSSVVQDLGLNRFSRLGPEIIRVVRNQKSSASSASNTGSFMPCCAASKICLAITSRIARA